MEITDGESFNRGIDSHREFNRQTAALRDAYHAHRETLKNCVQHAARLASPGGNAPAGKIAWLGAGNCNDLDLPQLLAGFESVHLVDADREALVRGVAATQDTRLHLYAPIDLASPLLTVQELTDGEPILAALSSVPEELPVTDCDVVVSAGLLSQLMHTLTELREPTPLTDQAFLRTVQAVRRGHLRRLAAMLRPGGVGVLTLELIASDSVPELLQLSSGDQPALQGLMARLATDGHYFTGMNPTLIAQQLTEIDSIGQVVPSLPWVWNVGSRRYLVVSMLFRRIALSI